MTPEEVAAAWHSVTDEWITRRNKMLDGPQWEVVHVWGGSVISDDTQKVLRVFATETDAEAFASECEDIARGAAVLAAMSK